MLTAEMFSNITSTITSNCEVLIPVGVGIMGLMLGIRVIPKVLYQFF